MSVVLPILTFLALLFAGVTSGVEVMSIGDKYALHVDPFDHGILRATLRPQKEWAFEVPEVIQPQPLQDALSVACANKTSCTARQQQCSLQADVQSNELHLRLTCDDTELTTAVVPLSELASPTLLLAFPAAKVMYGLPEHAADLPLRAERTYELYNTDAFQYKVNSTAALYGSIPFIMAYAARRTTGVLFLNAAEMKVNVLSSGVPSCNWRAEVGLLDLFFFPGPTPAKVQQQNAYLTGTSMLPPYFSLGFHQCRWNYLNTKDCLAVDEGFDTHNMPYDALWLDIEHTEKKKYFTWDKYNFPDPKVLTDALAANGRKLVTIKDPHTKREPGFSVHDEAVKGGHYIQTSSGGDFEGDCWPGRSSWPDFLNRRTREWYATFFHDDRYPGGSRDIHTWLDMNEPSVFQGPQGTMSKEAVHVTDDGHRVEHRYLHNMYGLLSTISVYKGTLEAAGEGVKAERPFILTRSFFAGSQRYAAMWNGDNQARWEHLENTVPELLSLSISNYPFCGCDVGGFFFEPEEELFVRWMQSGIFYPFFRAHAHLDTKRREPWHFSPEGQQHIRNALALRYALIPYLYTAFYHAHRDGQTIMRPLIYEFPAQEELREEQQAFMFGPSLLVSPVIAKGATQVQVPLPKGSLWYVYQTGEAVPAGRHTMPVSIDTIPIFVRGGHIVPMKLRLRRSTRATMFDPFTLFVALNHHGNSYGDIYMDDGVTFDYEGGAFNHRQLAFSQNTLTNSAHPDPATVSAGFTTSNQVERVVLFGYQPKIASIRVVSRVQGVDVGRDLAFERVGTTVIIRKPELPIASDWTMLFENAEDPK